MSCTQMLENFRSIFIFRSEIPEFQEFQVECLHFQYLTILRFPDALPSKVRYPISKFPELMFA